MRAVLGRAWVVATLSCFLSACEEPPTGARVATTITITPSATVSLTAIGATRQLSASVRDQNGDTLANAPIVWSTSNAAAVSVSVSGLATAVANGSAQVTAQSDSLSASVTVSVAQAAAQLVKVSGDAQTDTVDQVLSQPLVVQVNDATGHAMTGVSVGFAATAGSGSTGAMSATTNASGQAQTTWTLGQTAGNQNARATLGSLPFVSFAATATADSPASVAKQAGDGQTAVNGQAVAVRPAVIVRDAFNNPVPGAAVTFATTAGNGAITGASQTTNAMGIATVGSWTLGDPGSDTLRATVTGTGISGNPAVFTATATTGTPALALIASGLSSALYVTAPPGDTNRIFVVQQSGAIRVVRHDTLLTTPFLNLSGIIAYDGSERGLLSLAFHPNYASNRQFYVDYTAPNGALTIVRYLVSATDSNVADPASGTVLLSIPHSANSNHNGGLVLFGPDGYLYVGTGDGGGGGDPDGNGQDSTVLLGKILRIDVDGAFPYAIPASNPFVGRAPAAPEVWAYGMRNPWRFSFDRSTDDFYIGDVGQNAYEEIDFAPAGDPGGHNYGWNTMEGLHCYSPATGCVMTGLVLPVYEYGHSSGNCSITGGYVYRGTRNPSLAGRYFFADYCVGRIRSVRMVGGAATDHVSHTEFPLISGLTSFGEDGRGELYITRANGEVYRITPQ